MTDPIPRARDRRLTADVEILKSVRDRVTALAKSLRRPRSKVASALLSTALDSYTGQLFETKGKQ
jgi:hypothetical protein